MTDKEKILAFIEERIEWNKEMMSRDPKPSDIGRIEEAKCIMRFIDSMQENPCDGCTNRKGCVTCENGELRETMQEEPVSDELEKVVEEIVDPTVLNVYGVKEIANRLRRTMIDSASEELEEVAGEYAYTNWQSDDYHDGAADGLPFDAIGHTKKTFIAGAQWQKEQFEKNRLKHCNSITNEQAELEQGFIDQHLDKYQRMPTFLDAIEYGMRLQKQQMMKDAEEAEITNKPNDYGEYMPRVIVPVSCSYKEGEKVKVIIIKEG